MEAFVDPVNAVQEIDVDRMLVLGVGLTRWFSRQMQIKLMGEKNAVNGIIRIAVCEAAAESFCGIPGCQVLEIEN